LSVTLNRLVREFRERGEVEEAEYLEWVIPLEIMMLHNFTYEQVMKMPVEEAERWYGTPPKPLKYDGWNHWYGKAA